MDENGEILQLHASKNKARPLILPWALYTLGQQRRIHILDIKCCNSVHHIFMLKVKIALK